MDPANQSLERSNEMVTEYLRRAALGVAHDVSIPELPIPPRIYFGAIAYVPTGEVGIARRQVSSALAEVTAMQQCGVNGCKGLSSCFTRCGAVAYNGAKVSRGDRLLSATPER
jgi:hypothetical protein